MPSDDERFRFLDQYKLTASWDDEEFTLFWREKSVPWLYGRLYVISKGKTLAEATDAAMDRWEKKHGTPWSLSRATGHRGAPELSTRVQWLQIRGWVS